MKAKLEAVANAPTTDGTIAEMNQETLNLIGLLVAGGEQDLSSIITEGIRRIADDLQAAKFAVLAGQMDISDNLDSAYFRLLALAKLSSLDRSSFERRLGGAK